MPKDGAQPRAVENLRNLLGSVGDTTGVFNAAVQAMGEYFRSPQRERWAHDDEGVPRIVEPGQVFLADGRVLVKRRTLDAADSGVFVLDGHDWERRRTLVEESYTKWVAAIEAAIGSALGLRSIRARFCPALTEQWFTDLLVDLRELLHMRQPSVHKDGSSFWKFRSAPLPERAKEILPKLKRAWLNLADVEPASTNRRVTAEEVLVAIGRDAVKITDLALDIGPTQLRAADVQGWIEVRDWARFRTDRPDAAPEYYEGPNGTWFSPARAPPNAGDLRWETLYYAIAPPWNPSFEVRATDLGLVTLEKIISRRRPRALRRRRAKKPTKRRVAKARRRPRPRPRQPVPRRRSTPASQPDIAALEAATPPLVRGNGAWVTIKIAAVREALQPRTLAKYRSLGIKNENRTLGKDRDGRVWRRQGTPRSHPWYWVRTLVSAASKTPPKP